MSKEVRNMFQEAINMFKVLDSDRTLLLQQTDPQKVYEFAVKYSLRFIQFYLLFQ